MFVWSEAQVCFVSLFTGNRKITTSKTERVDLMFIYIGTSRLIHHMSKADAHETTSAKQSSSEKMKKTRFALLNNKNESDRKQIVWSGYEKEFVASLQTNAL